MSYTKIKNQAQQFLDGYKSDNPATFAAAQQAVGGLLVLDGFVGIENPLGGRKRSGIFGSLIGIIVGVAFIFGGSFFADISGINKMTETTTATVTGVIQPTIPAVDATNKSASNNACSPQATYTVGGKEYTQTASMGSNGACSLSIGQTIEINYDPNNPGAWGYDVEGAKTVLKIFPIIGIIFGVASLITFIIRLLSIIFGWKLLKGGRALAKSLPAGTDISTIKNEIKQNFAKSVFGMGGSNSVSPQNILN